MTDETPPAETGTAGEVLDRRTLLEILAPVIRETADRVAGERFRVRDGDRERLAYLRTLTVMVQTYNAVLTGAKDHNFSRPKPRPLTDREKARAAAMDARMEELLDGFAGI